MVAGLLAETVTGVPYRTLVHDRVLAPLGMNRTVFLPSEVLADGDYAIGKTCDPAAAPTATLRPASARPSVPDTYDNPWGRPAGYAWSSVLDMAKLATFLVHGDDQVLGRELTTAMTSPQVAMPETAGRAAYGFGVVDRARHLFWPRPGPGALLRIEDGCARRRPGRLLGEPVVPARGRLLLRHARQRRQRALHRSLVTAIETLVTFPRLHAAPDVAPRLDRFDAYAGTYVDPFALGTVQITAPATACPRSRRRWTPSTRSRSPPSASTTSRRRRHTGHLHPRRQRRLHLRLLAPRTWRSARRDARPA